MNSPDFPNYANGLMIDPHDNFYMSTGTAILKILPDWKIITYSGDLDYAGAGMKDGPIETARYNGVGSFIWDKDENIYFVDANNHRIRKIVVQ